jgi:predicted metal-dependent hydrolase
MPSLSPPRFAPERPLPPYSYVSGLFPHPVSDPRGHSYGVAPERPAPPDPTRWQECRPYLFGIDLFNHGYYWEAHEVWESLWHACGRAGITADFLKGLIKLAAAGVKVREGKPQGVVEHARRAAELFRQVAHELGDAEPRYFGLSLLDLIRFAEVIVERQPSVPEAAESSVPIVFDLTLLPS